MGSKVGLQATDNGFLVFKNIRVPYDNMLDKFSQISESGEFQSLVSNPDKRFAFAMGALTGGRVVLTTSTCTNLTNALAIATRFAHVRRQFGLPNQPETAIIEYPLVQYRLVPQYATLFGIIFANHGLMDDWNEKQDKLFDEKSAELAEIHALSSVLKPYSAWFTQKGI